LIVTGVSLAEFSSVFQAMFFHYLPTFNACATAKSDSDAQPPVESPNGVGETLF